jgi:hypothetical protein
MGFSLVHTLLDVGLVLASSSSRSAMQQDLITLLIGLLYTWWAWVLVQAVGGEKSGLVGLMAFDVLWVSLNGVSIIYCLPPCGSVPFFGDTVHLGNLILDPLAAYFAYRAMRRISGPVSWLAMVGNIILVVVFLVTIITVVASLANA